jgi:hypothetical protein
MKSQSYQDLGGSTYQSRQNLGGSFEAAKGLREVTLFVESRNHDTEEHGHFPVSPDDPSRHHTAFVERQGFPNFRHLRSHVLFGDRRFENQRYMGRNEARDVLKSED